MLSRRGNAWQVFFGIRQKEGTTANLWGFSHPPVTDFGFCVHPGLRWSFEITFVLVSPPLLSVSGFYFVLVDGDLVFGHDESRSLADVLE